MKAVSANAMPLRTSLGLVDFFIEASPNRSVALSYECVELAFVFHRLAAGITPSRSAVKRSESGACTVWAAPIGRLGLLTTSTSLFLVVSGL
jgi:hypothetical protein